MSSPVMIQNFPPSLKLQEITSKATSSSLPMKAIAKSDFDTLTERLAPEKKMEVLQKIDQLRIKESLLQTVIDLANTRDYIRHKEIFQDPNFEYYALALVRERKLSSLQFGTLMFARSALEQVKVEEMKTVPLFQDDAPSTDAWNYIKATFVSPPFNAKPCMGTAELTRFFELMRALPTSEQHFVLIPDTRSQTLVDNIFRAVNGEGFNLFCGLEINGKPMRMIPSFGMFQAVLDATGNDGFKIKPVIGESTTESLRLSVLNESSREVCVHCPLIAPAPKKADGYTASAVDFTYHDFYHTWSCRHIPKEHRKFYCELADYINPACIHYACETAKKRAQALNEMLIDMNFKRYRPEHGNNKDGYFEIAHILDQYILDNFEGSEFAIKVKGLFAIWFHSKQGYCSFEEITEMYEKLESRLRDTISGLYTLI